MGVSAGEILSGSAFAPAYKIFSATPGILKGITLFAVSPFIDSGSAYAEVGIGTNIEEVNSRQIILAGGNCGTYKSLFFDGDFPLQVDDYICVLVMSLEVVTWRLNFKIIPETRKANQLVK